MQMLTIHQNGVEFASSQLVPFKSVKLCCAITKTHTRVKPCIVAACCLKPRWTKPWRKPHLEEGTWLELTQPLIAVVITMIKRFVSPPIFGKSCPRCRDQRKSLNDTFWRFWHTWVWDKQGNKTDMETPRIKLHFCEEIEMDIGSFDSYIWDSDIEDWEKFKNKLVSVE